MTDEELDRLEGTLLKEIDRSYNELRADLRDVLESDVKLRLWGGRSAPPRRCPIDRWKRIRERRLRFPPERKEQHQACQPRGIATLQRKRPPRGRPVPFCICSSTATGIRTPVSGLRIRRPSPLDDSGEDAGHFSEPAGGGARRRSQESPLGRRGARGAQPVNCLLRAAVAELVDAHGSGPCGREPVEVRLLSAAFRSRICLRPATGGLRQIRDVGPAPHWRRSLRRRSAIGPAAGRGPCRRPSSGARRESPSRSRGRRRG
jgi:hypothetical protein